MIGKFLRNAAVALVKPHVRFYALTNAVGASGLGCSVRVDETHFNVNIGNKYEFDVYTWSHPSWCPPGRVWSRDVGGLSLYVTSVPLRRAEYAKQRTEQVSLN